MSFLPSKKTPAVSDLGRLSLLIHGAPKIGKSTLASKFPNVLFLACEPGLAHIETHQVAINNWDDFLKACAELAEGKHHFRTIVVDTIDICYRYCVEYILKKYSITHEADLPYGKAWALISAEFSRVCLKLLQLGYGVIFISHTTEKEYETRTGKITKKVITLPEKPARTILGLVDCILFLDIQEDKDEEGNKIYRRVIHSKPSPFFDAGDRSGRLPSVLELSYHALADAFKRGENANKSITNK